MKATKFDELIENGKMIEARMADGRTLVGRLLMHCPTGVQMYCPKVLDDETEFYNHGLVDAEVFVPYANLQALLWARKQE